MPVGHWEGLPFQLTSIAYSLNEQSPASGLHSREVKVARYQGRELSTVARSQGRELSTVAISQSRELSTVARSRGRSYLQSREVKATSYIPSREVKAASYLPSREVIVKSYLSSRVMMMTELWWAKGLFLESIESTHRAKARTSDVYK